MTAAKNPGGFAAMKMEIHCPVCVFNLDKSGVLEGEQRGTTKISGSPFPSFNFKNW